MSRRAERFREQLDEEEDEFEIDQEDDEAPEEESDQQRAASTTTTSAKRGRGRPRKNPVSPPPQRASRERLDEDSDMSDASDDESSGEGQTRGGKKIKITKPIEAEEILRNTDVLDDEQKKSIYFGARDDAIRGMIRTNKGIQKVLGGTTQAWSNKVGTMSDIFLDVLRHYAEVGKDSDSNDVFSAAIQCLQAVGEQTAKSSDRGMQMNHIIFQVMEREINELIEKPPFNGDKHAFLESLRNLESYEQDKSINRIRKAIVTTIPKPDAFAKRLREKMAAEGVSEAGKPYKGDIRAIPAVQPMSQSNMSEMERFMMPDEAIMAAIAQKDAMVKQTEKWQEKVREHNKRKQARAALAAAQAAKEGKDPNAAAQYCLEEEGDEEESEEERGFGAAGAAGDEDVDQATQQMEGLAFDSAKELHTPAPPPVGTNQSPNSEAGEKAYEKPKKTAAGRLPDKALVDVIQQATSGRGGGDVDNAAAVAVAVESAVPGSVQNLEEAAQGEQEDIAELGREERDANRNVQRIAADPDPESAEEALRAEIAERASKFSFDEIFQQFGERFATDLVEDDPTSIANINVSLEDLQAIAEQLIQQEYQDKREEVRQDAQEYREEIVDDGLEIRRQQVRDDIAKWYKGANGLRRLHELFPEYEGQWKQRNALASLPETIGELNAVIQRLRDDNPDFLPVSAAEQQIVRRVGALYLEPEELEEKEEIECYSADAARKRLEQREQDGIGGGDVTLNLLRIVERYCKENEANSGEVCAPNAGRNATVGINDIVARYLMDHQEQYLYPQVLYNALGEIIANRDTTDYKDQLIAQLWHLSAAALRANNVLSVSTIDAYNTLRRDVSGQLRNALVAYGADNDCDALVVALQSVVGNADGAAQNDDVVPGDTPIGNALAQISQDVEHVSRIFNAAERKFNSLRVFYPAFGSNYRFYPSLASAAVPDEYEFSAIDYNDMLRNNLRLQIEALSNRLGFVIVKGTGEPLSALREKFNSPQINGWNNVCHAYDNPAGASPDTVPNNYVLDGVQANSQVLAGFGRAVSLLEASEDQSANSESVVRSVAVKQFERKLKYVYERLFMLYPGCFLCYAELDEANGDKRFSTDPDATFTRRNRSNPEYLDDPRVEANDVIVVRVYKDTVNERTRDVLKRGAYALKRTIFLTLTLRYRAAHDDLEGVDFDKVRVDTRTIAIRSNLCREINGVKRPVYQEVVYAQDNWSGAERVLRTQFAGNANLFFAVNSKDLDQNASISPRSLLGFWVGTFTGEAYLENTLPNIHYSPNVGMLKSCGIKRSPTPARAKIVIDDVSDTRAVVRVIDMNGGAMPPQDDIWNGLTVEYLCGAKVEQQQDRGPTGVGYFLMAYALVYYSKYQPKTLYLPVRKFIPDPSANFQGSQEAEQLSKNRYAEATVAYFYYKHFGLQLAPTVDEEFLQFITSPGSMQALTEYEVGMEYLKAQYERLFASNEPLPRDRLLQIPDFKAFYNLLKDASVPDASVPPVNFVDLTNITAQSADPRICGFYVPNYYTLKPKIPVEQEEEAAVAGKQRSKRRAPPASEEDKIFISNGNMFRYYPDLAELNARVVAQYDRLKLRREVEEPASAPYYRFQSSVLISEDGATDLGKRVDESAIGLYAKTRPGARSDAAKAQGGVVNWADAERDFYNLPKARQNEFRDKAARALLDERRGESESYSRLENSDAALSEGEEYCPAWAGGADVSQSTRQ